MILRICVFGAGSIGCYVGGRLAAAGMSVVMVGRPRLAAEIAEYGLTLSNYLGQDWRLSAEQVEYATDVQAAADADVVLVCVKSAATQEAAQALAPVIRADTTVISLQNGVRNVGCLADGLGGERVFAGMVPFNVVSRGEGRFHQGSEGDLEVQAAAATERLVEPFAAAGLPLRLQQDMRAVQWGKLLLNLNNPINALAGIPLKEQLAQRAYRRCLATLQREALTLIEAAGIELQVNSPLPPRRIARVLELPDWIFRVLARSMLQIDPLARSSMWEDLEAGRVTEVDWINGEVVALAASQGGSASANAKIVDLIRAAENGGRRDYSGAELLRLLND